jgi:hypothetical protein
METKGFYDQNVRGRPFLTLPPNSFQREIDLAIALTDNTPPCLGRDLDYLRTSIGMALSQGHKRPGWNYDPPELSPQDAVLAIRNTLGFMDRVRELGHATPSRLNEKISDCLGLYIAHIRDTSWHVAFDKAWDAELSSAFYRYSRTDPLHARVALATAERTSTTEAIIADAASSEDLSRLVIHLIFFQSHRITELSAALEARAAALLSSNAGGGAAEQLQRIDASTLLRPLHFIMGTVEPPWEELHSLSPSEALISLIVLFRKSREEVTHLIDHRIGVPRFLALLEGSHFDRLGFPTSKLDALEGLPIEALPVEHLKVIARGLLGLVSLLRERAFLAAISDNRMRAATDAVSERIGRALRERILFAGILNQRAKPRWFLDAEAEAFLQDLPREDFVLLTELAWNQAFGLMLNADRNASRVPFQDALWLHFLTTLGEQGLLTTFRKYFHGLRDQNGRNPREDDIIYPVFASVGPRAIAYFREHPDKIHPHDLDFLAACV